MRRTVFSASEPFFAAACDELMATFGTARIERLGHDAGCLASADADIAEVARACLRRPLVFVRHLMREVTRLPVDWAAHDSDRIAAVAVDLLSNQQIEADLALQVWTTGAIHPGVRSDELRRSVAASLRRHGFAVERAGQHDILSLCLTPQHLVVGLNTRAVSLADWPGGRVGLARDSAQISRAELKLDELFKVFDIPLPARGRALDLGASPGGWSRVLRRRGYAVWAVDPAPLDPRIAADPAVHHVKTTAAPFLARTDLVFDLVVNDMRMEPTRSCQHMLDAAHRLRPHGIAIMTLKISPPEALPTVHRAVRLLARSYEAVYARQLFHNRNEVTVVLRRREDESRRGRGSGGRAGQRGGDRLQRR